MAQLKVLDELHDMVALYFKEKLEQKEVDSRDIANLLKFLKDNNIVAEPGESMPMQSLIEKLKSVNNELEDDIAFQFSSGGS
jgi:hypothetical protein